MDDMDEVFKGIDPDKLPDDLKKMYKNLQADYTKKTQGLAEQRKQFEAKEQQWMGQLRDKGALEQEVVQWRNWFKSIEDQAKDGKDGKGGDDDALNPDLAAKNPDVAKLVDGLNAKIGTLQTQLQSFDAAFKDQGDRTFRMFNLQSQLNDLIRTHPDLEKDKLLKFAADNRMPDLNRAYSELYHDKIIDEEVQKRVQAELNKQRTSGITTTGGQHVLRRSDKTPKTFGEATQAILQEKLTNGTYSSDGTIGS